MKRLFALFLTFLCALTPFYQSHAGGLIIVDQAYWPPGPPRPQPPIWPPRPVPRPYAPLEVTYHHVNVKIDGQVATTSVDQEFYNPNSQSLEGTYLFPVPKGAQIDRFTMEIGGKRVDAELLAADKARGIYEDIVRKLRDPALMEYADRDVFKVRVFPIEPHSRKQITISYSQVLKSDSGLVAYNYSLNTEKYSAQPVRDLSVKVELANDRPLKAIYSPSHSVEIKRDGPNRAVVSFEATHVTPDTDFTLYFAPEKDELGVNLITHKTANGDGWFMLLASPGLDVKEKQLVKKDVAFVLDTSGSMAGKKLDQAKKALQFCVANLNTGDRFEILRFSTEVEPLFDKLVEANSANRARAAEFIGDLKPTGGTAIDDALRKSVALQSSSGDRPFVIIFLTDGRPTIGTIGENEIVANLQKANGGRTRVFCFGIGADVNTHLLDKIAEETRAFTQYVLPEEDIEIKVSSFFAKIKDPVLANPTIKFNGDVRVTSLYPSPLPDIFRGDQLVLVGRYSGKGDAAITLSGTANNETRAFTYEVKFPEENREHAFLPRLWATRRVGYLLDEIRLHGENAELRDEVTELARRYGIVTPYTAYLITEDETRRGVSLNQRSLRELSSDQAALADARANWQDFQKEKDGDKALAGSRYGLALKSANVPSTAAASGAEESSRALGFYDAAPRGGGGGVGGAARGGRGGGGGGGRGPVPTQQASRARLLGYSEQTQFVAGKNFFQNEQNWVDAEVQKHPDAKRVRIAFNSPEYFDLTRQEPQALPWLALGSNIQFVLKETIYEIYEP